MRHVFSPAAVLLRGLLRNSVRFPAGGAPSVGWWGSGQNLAGQGGALRGVFFWVWFSSSVAVVVVVVACSARWAGHAAQLVRSYVRTYGGSPDAHLAKPRHQQLPCRVEALL